ncbi:MAG: exo-alpha-sialidase [Planctomycetaceae bacterium]|nr:MAG: exo-alpha-sialidase [Planctomycetaceae bacterium]
MQNMPCTKMSVPRFAVRNQKIAKTFSIAALTVLMSLAASAEQNGGETMTYRHFEVEDADGRVARMMPVATTQTPLWAREVRQSPFDWRTQSAGRNPVFLPIIPFVLPPPEGSGEPFYGHNHQPDITWLPNGDLMAIWYSTRGESGLELTVLASRFRAGAGEWDPSSEFFKAPERNMHGSALFHDGAGTLYHFNGMGPRDVKGWRSLALLLRTSRDNGVSWTPPRTISSGDRYQHRHQVIGGVRQMRGGTLVMLCDLYAGQSGGTAVHVSQDSGKTFADPGGDILGVHAGLVELKDGRWMAFGRGNNIDGKMPKSISNDHGQTWTYSPTEFPVIRGGQRLVLMRLNEGPIVLFSFTSRREEPESGDMNFMDSKGNAFIGHGLFASLSYDEGQTWPVRKLITPGEGDWDGGAHHRRFTATPTRAEPAGYLAATQSPDDMIHLISSRLHYRFNLAWLEKAADPVE